MERWRLAQGDQLHTVQPQSPPTDVRLQDGPDARGPGGRGQDGLGARPRRRQARASTAELPRTVVQPAASHTLPGAGRQPPQRRQAPQQGVTSGGHLPTPTHHSPSRHLHGYSCCALLTAKTEKPMRTMLLVLLVGASALVGCGGAEAEQADVRFERGGEGLLMSMAGSDFRPAVGVEFADETGQTSQPSMSDVSSQGLCCDGCHIIGGNVVCPVNRCKACLTSDAPADALDR